MTFFWIFDFLFSRRRARRSARAQNEYGQGSPVSLAASFSGRGFLSGTWVPGVLELERGALTWHGFGVGSTSIRGDSFEATGLRQVRQSEGWFVGTKSVVLMGELAGSLIEVAVLDDEMAILLDAVGADHLLQ